MLWVTPDLLRRGLLGGGEASVHDRTRSRAATHSSSVSGRRWSKRGQRDPRNAGGRRTSKWADERGELPTEVADADETPLGVGVRSELGVFSLSAVEHHLP